MIRRLIEAAITMFIAIVAVFFMIHLVPGDPAQTMLGEKATPEAIAAIRSDLGLDQPLLIQLGNFFKRFAHGDWGRSIRSGRPVLDELRERTPATLELSVLSLMISVVVGILLGIFAARKPGGWTDFILGAISVFGLSIPIFFLGLLLVLLFGLKLGWFPLSGRLSYAVPYEPWTGFILLDSILQRDADLFAAGLSHLFLPAVTLATVPLSLLSRLTRSSLLDCLKADYIRTARAKGQSEFLIFLKHGLRNALLPVITMTGYQFGLLLGGAILTENVFAWPGLGRWIVFAVEGRDYPAVQGAVLFFVAGIITVMTVTDLVHQWVDPRLRTSL